VKGGHQIKVREALDLVTFLRGLLNLPLRVIIMENPKDAKLVVQAKKRIKINF
jgi:hypothetical protein